MKKYKVQFSPLIIVLLAVCEVLLVLGLTFSIISLVNSFKLSTVIILTRILITLLNLMIFVFSVSVVFFSKYTLKKEYLILNIGFISTKYKVSDVVEINLFKKTNKLVVYFKDYKYTVIVISPQKYEDFIKDLREINSSIVFGQKTEEEK